MKDINLKDITLEWYADYFNNVLYPSNYPYYLVPGIGTYDGNTLYLTIQIHHESGMLDALKVWGKTSKEVIEAFRKLEFSNTLKCLVKE